MVVKLYWSGMTLTQKFHKLQYKNHGLPETNTLNCTVAIYLLAGLLSSVNAHSLPSSLHMQMLASSSHSTGAFIMPLAIT